MTIVVCNGIEKTKTTTTQVIRAPTKIYRSGYGAAGDGVWSFLDPGPSIVHINRTLYKPLVLKFQTSPNYRLNSFCHFGPGPNFEALSRPQK